MSDVVPIKRQMSDVLKLLYAKAEANGHADGFPLRELADELELPIGLVVKISKHLEALGLIEYESGTIDLTVDGIVRVQEANQPAPAVVVPPSPAPKAKKKR